MDLFLALMTVFFLYRIVTSSSLRKTLKTVLPYYSLFALFFVVVLLGFTLNASSDAPVMSEVLKLRWGLFPLVTFFYLTENRFSEEDLSIHLWFLCGLGLFCVVQHVTGYEIARNVDPNRWKISGGFRVSGFLGSPILFAHCMGLQFAYLVALCLKIKNFPSLRNLIILATLFVGLSLLLSFTRGIWMAVLGAALVQAFCLHWKKGILVLGLSTLVLGLAYATVPYVKNRVQSFTDDKDQSNTDRVLIWKTNLDIFRENPFFGIGLDENQRRVVEFHRKFGRPKGMEGHAHSEYLQILAGTGFLGFCFFYLFLLQFFALSLLALKKSPQEPAFQVITLGNIGALIVFFIGALTEANLERAAFRNSFVLVLGAILYVTYKSKAQIFRSTSSL